VLYALCALCATVYIPYVATLAPYLGPPRGPKPPKMGPFWTLFWTPLETLFLYLDPVRHLPAYQALAMPPGYQGVRDPVRDRIWLGNHGFQGVEVPTMYGRVVNAELLLNAHQHGMLPGPIWCHLDPK